MADIIVVATAVVKYDGAETAQGIAGEAVTAGMTLYKHTDGKLYKALADTALHAACVGVALNGGAASQPIVYLTSGGLNPGVAVTVGEIYGVTDTAGGISLISERGSADFITTLGIATTTSRINVNIDKSGAEMA